ncbi:MAG: hypothetical protein GTN71_01160, partial [Anaerolineae bacterium]|nr:hypothetical protein [Anaerolineae bacterium]
MKRMILLWLSAVMIGALIVSGCGPTAAPTEVPPTPTPKPAAPTPVPAAEEFTLGLSLSTL